MISKGAEDEYLYLNEYSIKICIWRLIDYINKNIPLFPVSQIKTKKLIQLRRTDGINKDYLKEMSQKRSREPILISVINNEIWVIDGNHRLTKQYEEKTDQTLVMLLPQTLISNFTQKHSLRI